MTSVIPLKSIRTANSISAIGEFVTGDTISNDYLEHHSIIINGQTVDLGNSIFIDVSDSYATNTSPGSVQLTNDIQSNSEYLVPTANALHSVYQIASSGNISNDRLNKSSVDELGIVQLYDGVDSNTNNLAATANSVKNVYDFADTKLSKSGGDVLGALNVSANVTSPSFMLDYGAITSKSITIDSNDIPTTIDSFSIFDYQSAQYWIQIIKNSTPKEYHFTNIVLINDSDNFAILTEFGRLFKDSMLGHLDVSVRHGNAELEFSDYGDATVNNLAIKFIRMAIKP